MAAGVVVDEMAVVTLGEFQRQRVFAHRGDRRRRVLCRCACSGWLRVGLPRLGLPGGAVVVDLAQDHVDVPGNVVAAGVKTFRRNAPWVSTQCRNDALARPSRPHAWRRRRGTASTLRSAPAGAPLRIRSATSADQAVEVGVGTRLRFRLRPVLCAGPFGHQGADQRRDVGERPVAQHVTGHGDEAFGSAAIDFDVLAVWPLRTR